MTGQAPAGTADDAARVLIGRDVGFLIGLMTSLTNRQTAGDQGATSLLMTYLDWVSLVVYEVREVGRRGIASINLQQAINHESEIAASRHSAKLLDDTKKTVEDQLAAFRRFSARHREQLIDKTCAPFAMRIFPWLGRLQDDTGVVLCGNDVIATTLSYRFHLGLDMDSDGSIVQSRGYELGAFLGAVRDERGTTWAEQTRAADLTFPPVHAMDTKYEEFFGSTFSGLPVPESMALSIIACRLRAVLVMSDAARSAGEVPAHLSFKFRFAMTWQVASTMRTIAANKTSFQIDHSLADDMHRALRTPSVASMAEPGLRLLRNVLVHYGVREKDGHMINWDDPLLGLPQGMCSGRTWRDLDALIDEAGTDLLTMLDRWRGPVDDLLRVPS